MEAPRVRLRLSPSQVALITPGLRRIVGADYLWTTRRELPREFVDPRFYDVTVDTRLYKPDAMLAFSESLMRLTAIAQGGRVRLHVYELAACMLAARHTRLMIRHGHIAGWEEHQDEATEALLQKMELYRRRAKRRFEKRLGQQAYRDAGEIWVDMLAWIHTFYLWCPCNQPKGWRSLRLWYRGVVDRAVVLANEGLARRKCYCVHPVQLRPAVRRALRSARRRKTGLTVRTILERPRDGGDFLAEFVLRSGRVRIARDDMSTRLSQLSERLAHLDNRSVSPMSAH